MIDPASKRVRDQEEFSADTALKILVVDDEPAIRDIFEAYFRETTDHTVFTAENGREGLEIVCREKIDCCFTDLSMPVMDGIEFVRRVHHHDRTIPVVVMTGYPSVDSAIATLRNGVVDFLPKPVRMDQLRTVIHRIMRERALFVENLLLKEEALRNERLLKINEELTEKIKEVETLNLILQKLDHAPSSNDLLKVLVNLSGEVTACDESHFCVLTEEGREAAVIASFFRSPREAMPEDGGVDRGIIRKASKEGIPLLIHGNNGNGGTMAIPLKIRSKIFGVLVSVIKHGQGKFSERDLYFLNFLAEKAAFSIENLALYENIYENVFSTLYAFVETIEARDPYTKQHSARVTQYARAIGKAMGCSQDEMEVLNVAGNLHDIGKIGIPDRILLKPGRLTDAEYDVIKRHPVIGSNIIGHFSMWTQEQEIMRHHHERWDGKGYPDGLKGEAIPLLSRILAVADTYDAVTSDRSYRRKLSDETAVKIIRENAGTQFDPGIAGVFVDLHERREWRSLCRKVL